MTTLTSYRGAFGHFFQQCVMGYHMLNTTPIKEGVWEEINAQVFRAAGCAVTSTASGSHASGADIQCALGALSNKSVQYSDKTNTSFSLSSYRLTTVCSAAKKGTPADIVAEIKRRDNFDYYSVIARPADGIQYDWYLIPKTMLDAAAFTWEPMMGMRGANTGEQVGWRTDVRNGIRMKITFSMSSQLWIDVGITPDIAACKVAHAEVPTARKQYSYIELAGLLGV